MWNFGCGYQSSACLQYVYRFRIAEAVPTQGDMSYVDLAIKAGVDEGQCTRILRILMTQNYFQEPRPGYVSHTAGSSLLQPPIVRDHIGFVVEDGFPSESRISDTVEEVGASVTRRTTHLGMWRMDRICLCSSSPKSIRSGCSDSWGAWTISVATKHPMLTTQHVVTTGERWVKGQSLTLGAASDMQALPLRRWHMSWILWCRIWTMSSKV